MFYFLSYASLLKPRVMILVVFTALPGITLSGAGLGGGQTLLILLSIALGAGGAAAFNMWYEKDSDAKMSRTCQRPLPKGSINKTSVFWLSLLLAMTGSLLLWFISNILAASLLALAIIIYGGLYTMWLKKRTPQNIVIGGLAGALSPIIGWAAATGHISPLALTMGGIIFLWTPPHFWSLALQLKDDYSAANIPMLPVVSGEETTRRSILLYTLLLTMLAQALLFLDVGGLRFAALSVLLNALCLLAAWRFWKTKQGAMTFFSWSIFYLFSLFALLLWESF